MSNHEAVGATLVAYNNALARHQAALKRLALYGERLKRLTSSLTATTEWHIHKAEDLRWDGGILTGDGQPIMPSVWPTFDEVSGAIKERDASEAERDTALKHLKELGLDPPDGWK